MDSHFGKHSSRAFLFGIALLVTAPLLAGNGHILHGFGAVNSSQGGPDPAPFEVATTIYVNPALLTEFEFDQVVFSCELFVSEVEIDLRPRRARLDLDVFDLSKQPGVLPVIGLSRRETTRFGGFGLLAIAGFRTLSYPVADLPNPSLVVATMRVLGQDEPPPILEGRCTVSQAEGPCVGGGTTACVGSDLRWKVGATRNGAPLGVRGSGEFFALFTDQVEVQVFGQCGDPDIKGYTVQVDSAFDGVVIDVTDTWTGASGYFFPDARTRLLDFGAFQSCP